MTYYADDYNRELLAEVYDQTVTDTRDVELLRSLLRGEPSLSILECFSGTGRILIPLLQDGHRVTGIEIAPAMAARARQKAEMIGALGRLTLMEQDALTAPWGDTEYDVVVIGGNALFELSTADMQQQCIKQAHGALKPGGRLFIDNDNWNRPLQETVGERWVALEGMGRNGAYAKQCAETVSVEPEAGVMHIRRTWFVRGASGSGSSETYMTRKRPVSGNEVRRFVEEQGFNILQAFGDYHLSPLTETSTRAILWARK